MNFSEGGNRSTRAVNGVNAQPRNPEHRNALTETSIESHLSTVC